jgi:hypothetical protein
MINILYIYIYIMVKHETNKLNSKLKLLQAPKLKFNTLLNKNVDRDVQVCVNSNGQNSASAWNSLVTIFDTLLLMIALYLAYRFGKGYIPIILAVLVPSFYIPYCIADTRKKNIPLW